MPIRWIAFLTNKYVGAVLLVLCVVVFCRIFDYPTGIFVLAALMIHEYGHLWAAKKVGWKTQGMVFIPFLGGIGFVESTDNYAHKNIYVAIMGPLWGAFCAAILFLGGDFTGWAVLSKAAHWTVIINLFNLLPIYPLDGGRIISAVIRSFGEKANVIYCGCALIIAVMAAVLTLQPVPMLLSFFLIQEFPARLLKYKARHLMETNIKRALALTTQLDHTKVQPILDLAEEFKNKDMQEVLKPREILNWLIAYACLGFGLAWALTL